MAESRHHTRRTSGRWAAAVVASVGLSLGGVIAPLATVDIARADGLRVGPVAAGPDGPIVPVSGTCPSGVLWSGVTVVAFPAEGESGSLAFADQRYTPDPDTGAWTVDISFAPDADARSYLVEANCVDTDGNRVSAGSASWTAASWPAPTGDADTEVLGVVIDRSPPAPAPDSADTRSFGREEASGDLGPTGQDVLAVVHDAAPLVGKPRGGEGFGWSEALAAGAGLILVAGVLAMASVSVRRR